MSALAAPTTDELATTGSPRGTNVLAAARRGEVARRVGLQGLSGLLVAGLGLFILAPLVLLAIWAFAAQWFFPQALPSSWTLSWWTRTLSGSNLLDAVKWSFIFAPVVTAVSALVCLPAAWAFARRDFPGKRFMMMAIFATNAFPKMGLYIAMASLFYSFNLMGTFVGVVVVQLLNTLVVMTWIPAAAFASVPVSLEEAARDVGAPRWRVFSSITLRLAAPGIIVALILAFLSSLDEAQGTLIVGLPNYVTMPVDMYSLVATYPGPATAVFAILLTIPSLVLLGLVRKHVFSSTLAQGYRLR